MDKTELLKNQAKAIIGRDQVNLIVFRYNLERLIKNLDIFKTSKIKKGPLKIAADSLHGQISRQVVDIKNNLNKDTLGTFKYITANQELFTECFDNIYQCTSAKELVDINRVLKALLNGQTIHIQEKED